jgi:hypothetical protein
MKRTFISLSVIALIMASAWVPASAAVKAGGTCAKVNSTTTVSGYKYTCIKSGKKLVWSKGVKVSTSLANLPATCTIFNSEWRSIFEEGGANSDGQILLSSSVINSSISNVASDIKIYIEWYDNIGLSFKKTIEIPRLYPAQSINFGDAQNFEFKSSDFPGLPINVNVRSTCKSIPLNTKELVNGKFPILAGEAPANVRVLTYDDGVSKYVSTSFVVKNIFKKNMTITEEVDMGSKNKTHLYGVFKDKFGNILAGFNEYLRGDLRIIEPGETARVDMDLLSVSNSDESITERISTFEYTIIID